MAQEVAKAQVIEPYGPYGSQLPQTYRFQLAEGERISAFSVRHGYIIDAISFVVTKKDGSTYTEKFGGNGGSESKVTLKAGEYVTRITGTYGNYEYNKGGPVIATLKICTNLNPAGYGTYGGFPNGQAFESPAKTDGPVVGTFGRSGEFLESLGILIRKEFKKSSS
ncbi:hypothetical protein BVRB_4g089250 [Beta vulgaris subsp. vulgaris]|uniref:protein GOS9 n=1 Tax=Beta vulgaris subsp. vulgaris TaxID=3555 RepID=UPI00053F8AC4|nr:protein GOS9 [Beta vulgaris subsp. vulgaris]KMT12833.1 hypothetical protein BVRB_4g089250 [Beta vulgaris subsp. vulgaris]